MILVSCLVQLAVSDGFRILIGNVEHDVASEYCESSGQVYRY